MFSKLSRYHSLPEVHAEDSAGRTAASTSLRVPPRTDGTLRHVLEAADRLDHLAYKYYRQPTRWWRICDANPDHLSPLALLGKEPLVTDRFPLVHDDSAGPAPWPALVRRLEARKGVHGVRVEDRIVGLRPEERKVDDKTVTVEVAVVERAAVVRYNRLDTTPEDLAQEMADLGFEVAPRRSLGRVGKEIVIPPRTLGG